MIIESSEVTNDLVKSILEDTTLEASIINDDDGGEEIYVEGLAFPCFVRIDQERNLISIRTYVKCKESAPLGSIHEFVGRLNDSKILVKFTSTVYENGDAFVNGKYALHYKYGFIPKNFLLTLRKFSEIFISSIRENDKDDVFFQ